jgi:hypothetical protein
VIPSVVSRRTFDELPPELHNISNMNTPGSTDNLNIPSCNLPHPMAAESRPACWSGLAFAGGKQTGEMAVE